MTLLFLCLSLIPRNEAVLYETNEKGKIGTLSVECHKDTIGYHLSYVSDREITVIIDTADFSTLYARKVIDGNRVFEFERGEDIEVYFNGREYSYEEKKPVYDRHTLDYALRGFDYCTGFKTMFRLHVPELTIVNAELEVTGNEELITPAGKFECWKVQMRPRVIFTNMRFFFYIEKKYPHRFVRYVDSSGENSITLIEYRKW